MVNTDNIEPAVIVDEEADELMERLRKNTQFKEPSVVKEAVWNFDADEEEIQAQTTTASTKDNATDANEKDSKAETKPTGKMSLEAKRGSARVAVGMFDLTQKGIFIPLLTRKYKKKFSKEEQDQLIKIEHTAKKDLKGDDLNLSNKFEKLMGRMNKKIDEVPLQPDEKKDLEDAWYSYFDITEKELPPIYFVTMAMINAVGKRSIDLFTD